MATLVERCTQDADYETDGGAIDLNFLRSLLALFNADLVDEAYIVNALGLTVGQAAELAEILATQPMATDERLQWAATIEAAMMAGFNRWAGYGTAADVRDALGLV